MRTKCTRAEPELADRDTSDEDEYGWKRVKFADARPSDTPPISTTWAGKVKEFHDGSGLCSPGRWEPGERPTRLRFRLARSKILLALKRSRPIQQTVLELASGRYETSPFSDGLLVECRGIIIDTLGLKGADGPPPPNQPFHLPLIAAVANACGDLDADVVEKGAYNYTTGVPIGVGRRMPRTPAVFERKRKWSSLDETDYNENIHNYKSARDAGDQLEKQFKEEERLGMCFRLPRGEAMERYPGKSLQVAALGAIEKDDDTFRITHGGTHGVRVNNDCQPRDQLRMPGPAEEKEVMKRGHDSGKSHYCLQADVKKAHRRFLNCESDWGLQACSIDGLHVWISRVGTFGIGTASYWWSRLAALLGRCTWAFWSTELFWELVPTT